MAAVLTAFLLSHNAISQPELVLQISPDVVAPACNVNGRTVLEANDVANSGGRSVSMFTPQNSIIPAAIFTCGKFRLYYEDINQGVATGFNEGSLGAERRATLCAVLNYTESVINVNVNGTTDFIDIYIERSVDINNPADPTDTYLANAGPYFPPGFGSSPLIYNGHFYNHANTGTDPAAAQYDAHIKVNFHQYYSTSTSSYFPINYWNNYLVTTNPCCFDLYSVLLHEVTHAMGFLSCIGEDSITHDAECTAGVSFSLFDNLFLYYKDNTNAFTKVMSSATINPFVNFYTDPLTTNRIWLNDDLPPTNQPVYSGSFQPLSYPPLIPSLMSHMNAAIFSFTGMSQESPGYQPNYVMGPYFSQGQLKRTWTLAELRILLTMGYTLTSGFASGTTLNGTDNNQWLLTLNTAAYRTNSYTESMLNYAIPFNFMEIMTADQTMPNENMPSALNNSVLTFSVASLANIGDPNGDPISIMPNTLFGIRGVSNGANNHACIQVNANGDIITYTPMPGFHGRAQFGFYLWDGHERGALRIVTIVVQPPTTYFLTPGNEMIFNADYEDGTEIRQRVLNPNFENTQLHDNMFEGVYSGRNLSGGHPFNYVTNNWNIAGGDITFEAGAMCWMPDHPPLNFYGMEGSEWKNAVFGSLFNPIPPPAPGTNQRYHNFNSQYNYSALINPVSACNVYRFECDLNFENPGYTVGQTFQFQLQFVNNPSPNHHTELYYTAPVQVVIISIADDSWQHVVFDFQYCGTSTSFMNMVVEGIVTPQLVVTGTGNSSLPSGLGPPLTNTFTPILPSAIQSPFIDNISLKQITSVPPLTLNVTANPSIVCTGGTTNLQALPTPYLPCNATYTWQPGALSGYAVTSNPISSTTTFTATVNYACSQSATSTTTVTVVSPPHVLIIHTPELCIGDPPLLLQATQGGGIFSGPGVISSGVNYYFDPSLTGAGAYTITYTYTGPCGTVIVNSTVTVLPGNVGAWPKFVVASMISARSTGKGIITDNSGNVYVVGNAFTNGTGANMQFSGAGTTFTTNNSSPDIIVAKFSEQCGLIWYKVFGGPNDDDGCDIALDANGNVFITGTVSGTYTFAPGYPVAVPATATAAFVARLDPSNGDVTGFKHNTSLTTTSQAVGIGLTVSQSTGDVYMTGTFTQNITFSPQPALSPFSAGITDVFVLRMNNNLTSASWNTKIYSSGVDAAAAVALDASDNLFVGCTVTGIGEAGGFTFPAAGSMGQHPFIVKYNNLNTFVAGKIMGSNGNIATLKDLVCDGLGKVFFCGTFSGNITFAAGHSALAGDRQMYVTVINSNLTFSSPIITWTVKTGNPASSQEDALGITRAPSSGDIYFTGRAANNCTFPGFTPSSMTGIISGGEGFVARILSNGTPANLLYTTSSISVPFFSASNAVTVNSVGVQYNTGFINHATTFGTIGTFTPATGTQELFAARENAAGVFYRIEEQEDSTTSIANVMDEDVIAYPNPSDGNVELLFKDNVPAKATITITDISGRIVSTADYILSDGGIISLDMSVCESGTYIILIRENDRLISKRIVIQH